MQENIARIIMKTELSRFIVLTMYVCWANVGLAAFSQSDFDETITYGTQQI